MKTLGFKKGLIALSLSVSAFINTEGQTSIKNDAFVGGEKLSYEIYYTVSFVWVKAAYANFFVTDTNYHGKPAYQFCVGGGTIKTFDHFYTVRDTLLSIADKNTLQPLFYERIAHEDKYWAKDQLYFNKFSPQGTDIYMRCLKRNKPVKRKNVSFKGEVTDLVTMLYRLRNLDFDKMQVNQKVPFSIAYNTDDEKFDLYFRYLGKDRIKLKDGRVFDCIKIKPLLVKGQVFRDENGMTIWISDDGDCIPILIESKLRVGSVKAMLINVKNPRHNFGFSRAKD